MSRKKAPVDFVKWLEGQLEAFRARRVELMDVEALGKELESLVGRYRHEVQERAKRLIPILMRQEYVYGDWDDLTGECDMLCGGIKESPSLGRTATA